MRTVFSSACDPNKPDAPNPAGASRFQVGYPWRRVGDPERSARMGTAMMLSGYTIIALIGIAISGCSRSAPTSSGLVGAQASIPEIAIRYTNFIKLTTNVVNVNPELAALCNGPSKKMVDEVRVEFGPHANTAIDVYMNKVAADAFVTGTLPFQVGATVVKQKLSLGFNDADGRPVDMGKRGVGGMVKRAPGYDPEHGDWEYFYFEDKSKIESGRISSCVQCHNSAKGKDYVFGTWRDVERSKFRP
jgi:Cytochrome P460